MALSAQQIQEINNRVFTQYNLESVKRSEETRYSDTMSAQYSDQLARQVLDRWQKLAKQEYSKYLEDTSEAEFNQISVTNSYIVANRFVKLLTDNKIKNQFPNVKGPIEKITDLETIKNLGDKNKNVLGKEIDPKTLESKAKQNRLSEQAALMLTIDDVLAKIVKTTEDGQLESREKLFKNFAITRFSDIEKDKDIPTGHFFLTNNFTKTSEMSSFFKDLPPQVLSLLVPSIKMYKTFYPVNNSKPDMSKLVGYDWRIPFDDVPVSYKDETSEFVVNDIEKILSGESGFHTVGIKSFSYEYKGVNPAEINTNIHATIEIFFQNPTELIKEIKINFDDPRFRSKPQKKETFQDIVFSYSDLVNQASKTLDAHNEYFNDQFYKIKIESGYADIQPQIISEILIANGKTKQETEKIIKAIKETKVVLNLTPYSHNISFNDDGTIILKIDFIAAIDSVMASPDADLFAITEESKRIRILSDRYEQFVASKKQSADEAQQSQGECKTAQELKIEIENFKKEYPDLANLDENQIEEKLNDTRKAVYNGIFNYLIGKEALHSDEQENNIIKPKVYNALFKPEFLAINLEPSDASRQRIMSLKESKQLIDVLPLYDDKELPTLISYSEPTSEETSTWDTIKSALGMEIQKQKQPDPELAAQARKALDKRTQDYRSDGGQYYKIKFVLLGDILDIALECLNSIKPISEAPKIVVGNIPVSLPTELVEGTGYNIIAEMRAVYPNLADIPISFNLFQEFMIEHIVRPKKDRYPIIQFLKDIISDLIIPAIQPSVFGQTAAINSSIRFSTAYFSVPTNSGLDPLTNRESDIRTYPPHINEDVIKSLRNIKNKLGLLSSAGLDTSPEKNKNRYLPSFVDYMFIVCTSQFPTNYNGDEQDDIENGVLHFRMGTDTGIIKKINFDKTSTPYLREMIARREGNAKGTTIKQVYNANVELFGNNIFRPGDYVYLHPNYTYGNKNLIDLEDKLGIGGYYMVIDVNTSLNSALYTTKLKCVFQAHVQKDKNNKKTVVPINRICSTAK